METRKLGRRPKDLEIGEERMRKVKGGAGFIKFAGPTAQATKDFDKATPNLAGGGDRPTEEVPF